MKHHRAIAPFEAVESARWWHDNTPLGYGLIARLIGDIYGIKLGVSTVRDWINETRANA